jgi:V/A-type H+-transporting ATPase subunit I
MAKFKLVKVQIPVKNTNTLLTKISSLNIFEQIIVDPQSPKEQARIQSTKDIMEDRWERIVGLSKALNIQLEDLSSLKEEDLVAINNHNEVVKSLDVFLEKYENQIIEKSNELQKLKKENRILSSLKQFQSDLDDEFSIDLLSSSSRTFTVLGEIPSGYEEIIRFYLNEVTAGQMFFWSSSIDNSDKSVILCISLADYKERIGEILSKNYFDETEFELELLKSIEKIRDTTKIEKLHSEVNQDIEKIEGDIRQFSSELSEEISYHLTLIKATHKTLTLEERGRTTSKNFTLWGWVTSKNYIILLENINSLQLDSNIVILEDVPLSRKKERDVEQELLFKEQFDKEESKIDSYISHLPHTGEGGEGFLFAKKALFVRLESPEESSRQFISHLYSLNAVHPVKIGSLNTSTLEKVNSLRQELSQYLSRVKRLSNMLKLEDTKEQNIGKYEIIDDYDHSKAFIENFLRENEEKITKAFDSYEEIQKKQSQVKLSLPFEEGLKEKGIDAVLLQSGFQTVTYLGVVPKSNLKSVRFFLNEVTDNNLVFWDSDPTDSSSNEKNILILSLKEYENAILRVLNEYSFQAIDYNLSLVERKVSLKDTLKEIETELKESEEKLLEIKNQAINRLTACEELINVESNRLNTIELCQISEGRIVLWGWISKTVLKQLNESKKNLSFKMEITENPEVPLVNPAITKKGKVFGAVRGIVGGIGHPNTNQVDPYSIVRFTFPFLFGIMFADIGHGILLSLVAGFLLYKKKKNKIEPDESMTGYLYSGAELLLFCGISATIFGFFFGSLLGDEHFIPELMHKIGVNWIPIINPLHETKLILIVALSIGFLMIQLGILLKVYQNMRYGHGFASWGAPLSLSIVYVGIFAMLYNIIVGVDGIYWHAFHFTVKQFPSAFVYLVGLVPVLFVLEYIHAKSEGIMDAIDHIIALISNTLSFSRIMALLLVHAILSGLPFTLTGVDLVACVSTFSGVFLDVANIDLSLFAGGLIHGHYASALSISWIWWVVGILLAVFIILPLEGLLSFLNTLRLHWVEWFSKFYTGDGKEFLPLKEKLVSINFIKQKGG